MTIIEFSGTPGCGKSTLCARLLEKLVEDEKCCAFDYNEIKNKNKIYNLKYVLMKKNLKLIYSILKYGLKNNKNHRTIIYSIKCAVIIDQIRQWSEEKNIDYLLFDEGILQYITTLSHGIKIDYSIDLINDVLCEFYANKNVFVINCRLNINENMRRLKLRNRENDRFLIKNDLELQDALALKKYNIEKVVADLSPINQMNINAEDTDIALEMIINKILHIT